MSDEQFPQPGTWTIDQGHSTVQFSIRHLMVAKVHGRFTTFDGTFTVGDPIGQSAIDVSIDAASITTGNDDRDAHLRSDDFLAVDRHPTLRFVAGSLERAGRSWEAPGQLTIRDTTLPVTLEIDYHGSHAAFGNPRAGFSATAAIDREDFGLTWNQALEAGGFILGNRVTITIDVEAEHESATEIEASDEL